MKSNAGGDGIDNAIAAKDDPNYEDLMKNPLIVPLKILRGHEVSGGLGVMSVAFHPVL
uniref:Uncharacterized protein n=1 Tax=Globisporangium ultimum (strain ATCC 200006 / CBS 805.95 / DAOM BR144) TaxID=431595 RepID=K3WBP4_GLOUD